MEDHKVNYYRYDVGHRWAGQEGEGKDVRGRVRGKGERGRVRGKGERERVRGDRQEGKK